VYSNKNNVNILTALLLQHGVSHAVVCPGSRNAPIVHNLDTCPQITCHPVTDERSAGFVALGMAQQLQAPVAVCVTSGSALLNVSPAVAEAFYQHVPLVVISADRPPMWIDQLDGQTIWQAGALGQLVKKAVNLPEPARAATDEWWHCNRLVNEALLAATADGMGPVHINVPIHEPLFDFTTDSLPSERVIRAIPMTTDAELIGHELLPRFFAARRPMIVVGQTKAALSGVVQEPWFNCISHYAVVLHEALADLPCPNHFDEALVSIGNAPDYRPDFVLVLGGTLVSKRLKQFLRSCSHATIAAVSESGQLADTFTHLSLLVRARPADVLQFIAQAIAQGDNCHADSSQDIDGPASFRRRWHLRLNQAADHAARFSPPYSQMAAVRYFEQSLAASGRTWSVHYANSSAVRLANIYADHYVSCNRGVNGIEGSLSAAVGSSLVAPYGVVCVIGDLSFFYDQNSLWNQQLRGNLRILLLNNGGGGIFRQLKGLEKSAARDVLVAAAHHTSAEGICRQNDVVYLSAHTLQQLQAAMPQLLIDDSPRPVLLEVFTDADTDALTLSTYLDSLSHQELSVVSKQ